MKKLVSRVLLITLMAALFLTGCSTKAGTTSAAGKKGLGKVLVVYYSFTGNTHKVAGAIKDLTGGDILEIQPEFDYFRADVEELAKKQISEGYKPKLKNPVSNIGSYDLIFVGSPVWWFSPAPPVMSFLSQYDLKDKKVVPFCTYKSASGDFFKKFENACPGANVLNGMHFTSDEITDIDKVKQKVEIRLKEIEKDK